MPDDQRPNDRDVEIALAWRGWLIRFVPSFIVILIAYSWFEVSLLPLLLGILIITLLYQRYVKKRTWHAIMWGVYASKKE